MKCNEPPKVIYLQVHGVDKWKLLPGDENDSVDDGDVTWCADKINDTDVRYVIDKRHLRGKRK